MELGSLTRVAMLGAGVMLAHQVAGKAVRDSFFLSVYPADMLPRIMMAAAVLSLVLALLFSRILTRAGPRPVVPVGFLVSGLAHIAEWHFASFREVVAVITYLHIVGLGAVLLSGFWSVASETFDPHTAKKNFGNITGAGTLGGILGGLMAERVAVLFAASSALLLLAVLHLLVAAILWALPADPLAVARRQETPRLGVGELFRRAPYLGYVAALVFLGTTAAAILDFLFKSSAKETLEPGTALLRFFAIYYTGTQMLTFAMQTFATRWALERLGLGRTVSMLPLAVGAGGLAGLLIPVFPVFAGARALEFVLRGSLFRSGYELLFTPIPPAEKRAAKTVLDVGCDRAGDAFGAGLVQIVLLAGPQFARSELLGTALAIALGGAWIASRLDRIYSAVVQKRLLDRAIELEFDEIEDSTTRSAVLHSQAIRLAAPSEPARSHHPETAAAPADEVIEHLRVLRSGNKKAVRDALRVLNCKDPVVLAQVVRLLAWDDVAGEAAQALAAVAPRITGLLVDHLVDVEAPFAVRRRIPRILRQAPSQRALTGLLEGLNDPRFEVRFQCGRAIDAIRQRRPELTVPEDLIFALVLKELSVAQPIWEGRKLLDVVDLDEGAGLVDETLRERADRSLEHVFTLLAAVLPREPLRVAYRSFYTNDPLFRGLALEYLDSVLPAELRERLYAMLKERPAAHTARPPEEILADLMRSHQSLFLPAVSAQPKPSGGDAPGRSAPPPTTTPPSDPHSAKQTP